MEVVAAATVVVAVEVVGMVEAAMVEIVVAAMVETVVVVDMGVVATEVGNFLCLSILDFGLVEVNLLKVVAVDMEAEATEVPANLPIYARESV